jgi:hypothetical protein
MRAAHKFGVLGLSALALVGSVGVAKTQRASADDLVHRLTMGGNVRITDDEVINRRNERCTREVRGFDTAQMPMDPQAVFSDTDNKCGGEVRVEFHVTAQVFPDGGFCITSGRALLFEGAKETNNDLDGTADFGGCVAPGQIITVNGEVRNTEEGGDKAPFSLTFAAT